MNFSYESVINKLLLILNIILFYLQIPLSTRVVLGPSAAITVSPDGVVHVADQKALKIVSFVHYLPPDNENGDFEVKCYYDKNLLILYFI